MLESSVDKFTVAGKYEVPVKKDAFDKAVAELSTAVDSVTAARAKVQTIVTEKQSF